MCGFQKLSVGSRESAFPKKISHSIRGWTAWTIVLLHSLFAAVPLEAAPGGSPVLVLERQQVQTARTLEVRFPSAMVDAGQVGAVSGDAPIVLSPALPGKFTWLSQKSGVFVPGQAPEMGRQYQIRARQGLRDAAGKAVDPAWKATFQTPAFDVLGLLERFPNGDDAPALPEVHLAFNRNVDPKTAEPYLHFVNKNGRSIAARVWHTWSSDYVIKQEGEGDWDRKWQELVNPQTGAPTGTPESPRQTESDEDDGGDGEMPHSDRHPILHRLSVEPVEPLPPGPDWRLEVKAGLPSRSPGASVAQKRTVNLGRVRAFVLKGVQTSSYLNAGRSAEIHFSHGFAEDVREESAPRFFRITPEPPGLEYELDFRGVTVRGKFEEDREYRLDVDPSLMSSAGHTITGTLSHALRFAPMEPRVYLPQVDAHQVAGGQRKFPVWSVNMKTLRVRAVLVDPEAAVEARQAFGEYATPMYRQDVFHGEDEGSGRLISRYQRVAPDRVRGKVIWEKTFTVENPRRDTRVETVLDWGEVLAGVRTGMIFLTVEGEHLGGGQAKNAGSQCLMQLTDLGVVWKKDASGLRAHVFSMATGQGVSGASLKLLNVSNELISSGQSDGEGNSVLAVSDLPGWLRVEKDGDLHLLALGPHGEELPMRAFGIDVAYAEWFGDQRADSLRGILFTDRPVYHRGETVHVKGIVREWGAKGLSFLSKSNSRVVLMGGRPFQKRFFAVNLDAQGAFSLDIPLPPGALGNYSLGWKMYSEDWDGEADTPSEVIAWQSLVVADFQPDAFDVALESPKRLDAAATLRAALQAKYFFGGALSKASAQWTLQMRSHEFEPEGWGAFTFSDSVAEGVKSVVLRGTGSLVAGGSLEIRPELPELKNVPMQGALSVDVTDVNQQTVSRRVSFVRDPATFYLGLDRMLEEVLRVGDSVKVGAVAVLPEGIPTSNPVRVHYELFRVRHETVRVQGAGKAMSFKTDRFEDRVDSRDADSVLPERQNGVWRIGGLSGVEFSPTEAGQYRIRATARDAQGRDVRSSMDFMVVGKERVSWSYRNAAQVELLPAKSVYAPGEKARIAVKTPISGKALVTVERGSRVLRSFSTQVEGNAVEVEVPVEAGDAPSVVVQAVLIRGVEDSTRRVKTPEYRYGACVLNVRDPAAGIQVKVQPSKERVMPGESWESVVEVLDSLGVPVPDARVTFYAVDDGILALRGFTRPNPQSIADSVPPLAVRTGITLYSLFPEDPAELTLANKGYLIGGGGGGDGSVKLRNDFPGTLAWYPDLRTDSGGKVRVKLTAPDALTRYRLVAVVHAGVNRFGSAESAVAIHKPFQLLSAVGTFAHTGDELVARVVARNDSPAAGRARVRVELDAQSETTGGVPLEREIDLQPAEARELDFPVRIKGAGQVRWIFAGSLSAGGTLYSDALEVPLLVEAPAPVLREVYLQEINRAETDLLEGVNPQMVEGSGSVEVTLSNTRLAVLRESADWLLKYPYGCAEQRISSLVPWVRMRDLAPVLPGLCVDEERIRQVIGESFAKVMAQQLPEGGIAYWSGGRTPGFFVSAYALWALGPLFPEQEAQEKQKQLVAYVKQQVQERSEARRGEWDACAFALAALAEAGSPEPAYHERFWERRAELSREGCAFLAYAILKAGGQRRQVAALLDPKVSTRENSDAFGSALRARAVRLMVWGLFEPQNPKLEVLLREVLEARKQARWRTTQENAWAILALSSYFKHVEKRIPVVDAFLKRGALDSGAGKAMHLDSEKLSQTVLETFGKREPLGGLRVRKESEGRLYAQTRFEVQPALELQPPQARGFRVSRQYWKESANGSWEAAKDLRVGDRVLVEVHVDSELPAAFVAIDDPLPAVLEPINPYFRREASGPGMLPGASFWVSHRQVQAGRVTFFCDDLPAGRYVFPYLARVRMAGKAVAPQTQVEEMYHPERFGLGASERVEAVPR